MKDHTKSSQEAPVLAISISTGWAVRNFFHTGIIENLQERFRLLVFTTPKIHENLLKQGHGAGIEFVVRDDLLEPLSWRLFRQLRKKLYMECRKSSTEGIWAKYVKRPFYQRVGGGFIRLFAKMFDANRLLGLVEDMDFALNNCERIDRIFQQHKPAIFFATHATTFFEESLLHSSVKNKVPAVFMVLSWDHLSSKVVLSRKYKSILVWNKITKAEILETCDAYRDEQITVVGVPQYDCYAEKPAISYAEWCNKYGLMPDKQTILFSTMPQVRHEQQHLILEKLLCHMEEKHFSKDLQVLIKCHPFDNTDKYDFLLDQGYPVGICRSTLPIGVSHESWFPSEEEMFVSRDALFYCAVNINIFSTVTLEAAFFDKPIIHIAFDPCPVENRIPCREYYNFEHFKNITKSGASIMTFSSHELIEAVWAGIDHPTLKNRERFALVEEYLTVRPGEAAGNVSRVLSLIHSQLVCC